jgi:prepilin-type N-terminal cleavage/methylation domain-containing protein
MRKMINADKSNPPIPPFSKGGMGGFSGQKGVTLTELLVVLAIFSIVIAGVYAVYVTQVKHTTREHRVAESEMELDIIKNFMERDIAMAGYGLADDYSPCTFAPTAVSATDGNPDILTLMGTALGSLSRGAQSWSYITSDDISPPTFKTWGDAREDIQGGDRIIYIEPNTKSLLTSGGCPDPTAWRFTYTPPPSSPTTVRGNLVYGLYNYSAGITEATQPYYAVRYYIGSGTSPSTCAGGTNSLLRAESRTSAAPSSGDPVLDCVRDLQVAFGLDTNDDGDIDCWDNGGTRTATYTDIRDFRKRLKQVRVYMLVQIGRRDPDREVYTAGVDDTFRVGDASLVACDGGTVGWDVTLTAEQRWYRWRVVSLSITPRNLR